MRGWEDERMKNQHQKRGNSASIYPPPFSGSSGPDYLPACCRCIEHNEDSLSWRCCCSLPSAGPHKGQTTCFAGETAGCGLLFVRSKGGNNGSGGELQRKACRD